MTFWEDKEELLREKIMKSASKNASGYGFYEKTHSPKISSLQTLHRSKQEDKHITTNPNQNTLRNDQVSVHSRSEIPPWSHVCSPPPCTHGHYHCWSWLRSDQGCEWKPMSRRVPGNIQGGKNALMNCNGHSKDMRDHPEIHRISTNFEFQITFLLGMSPVLSFCRLVLLGCMHIMWQCQPQLESFPSLVTHVIERCVVSFESLGHPWLSWTSTLLHSVEMCFPLSIALHVSSVVVFKIYWLHMLIISYHINLKLHHSI